ncbi:hypothetical protein [Achromobacter phage Motura]|uniref:Uncharacterized protein n=1 Tax=Achromobacter phage Motura TaxID=2591403 RepID=A0A514CSI6_9CAUD|nr:hypothetical protein H1O15_gp031 [Achromobacter phage Motura]QDH83439.1 hypothetical protein [Achromobacter phage Motura]
MKRRDDLDKVIKTLCDGNRRFSFAFTRNVAQIRAGLDLAEDKRPRPVTDEELLNSVLELSLEASAYLAAQGFVYYEGHNSD